MQLICERVVRDFVGVLDEADEPDSGSPYCFGSFWPFGRLRRYVGWPEKGYVREYAKNRQRNLKRRQETQNQLICLRHGA